MGKRRKLEPHIFRHLGEKGNTRLDLLINYLNKETGVSKDKIKFRIEKLASKGELSIKNNIVSRVVNSRRSKDQTFDETYQLGNIVLGRKDNLVSIESKLGAGDIKDFRKNAKKNLPSVKRDFGNKLKEIEESILKDHNPLDVLAFITTKNLLTDPETYTESSFKGNNYFQKLCKISFSRIILENTLDQIGKISVDFKK